MGGTERVAVTIANAAALRGCDVHLVCGRAEGPYLDQVLASVTVVDLGVRRFRWALLPLVRYLRRQSPRVTMAMLTQANLLTLVASLLSRYPGRLVVNERSTLSAAETDPVAAWQRVAPGLARRWYGRADAIVAVSLGVADDLVRRLGLPPQSVTVIPNPVDLEALRSQASQPCDHPWLAGGGPPLVLYVGRLSPEKDLATLLHAFSVVRRRIPARLLLLGEGPERHELQRLTDSLDLRAFVDAPGFVQNPYAYMARASLLVLSSRYEGWPNVLVEAMAVGCPVVATDCPSGPREILDGGSRGSLVPVGDVQALADALTMTLAGDLTWDGLTAHVETWSTDRVLARYLEVLGCECGSGVTS